MAHDRTAFANNLALLAGERPHEVVALGERLAAGLARGLRKRGLEKEEEAQGGEERTHATLLARACNRVIRKGCPRGALVAKAGRS